MRKALNLYVVNFLLEINFLLELTQGPEWESAQVLFPHFGEVFAIIPH